MTSADERIAAVFEAALLREGADRTVFIETACAGDVDLQRRVEALLAQTACSLIIDHPIGPAVAELLGSGDDPRAMIGTTVGPYRIDSTLGAGGMGEVYLATDTGPLARQVALKILPQDFSRDPDRVARFRREARLLASLSDPHLAHVYEFDEIDLPGGSSVHALAMEYVPGETLAERLAHGPLPIDEALALAHQIARGHEAAHQQGIIHRDLKPANIKVTPEGLVKILDFGLAKASSASPREEPSITHSPTITSPALLTGVGMLLGTAAYMSPEQAKGREADKRSDVWAFGCVLFEILTGRRAFDGDDVVDVLGAVARLEPNWQTLPGDVPPVIRNLLHRCLVKDRQSRLGDIAGAIFAIDLVPEMSSPGPAQSTPAPPRRLRVVLGAVVAAAAVGAITAVGVWLTTRPSAALVTRFTFSATGAAEPGVDLISRDLSISPDGRRVVYRGVGVAGQTQLFLRSLDELDASSHASWPDSRAFLLTRRAMDRVCRPDVWPGPGRSKGCRYRRTAHDALPT
jgi:hypothetical protein